MFGFDARDGKNRKRILFRKHIWYRVYRELDIRIHLIFGEKIKIYYYFIKYPVFNLIYTLKVFYCVNFHAK